jgi:hypothetical protein
VVVRTSVVPLAVSVVSCVRTDVKTVVNVEGVADTVTVAVLLSTVLVTVTGAPLPPLVLVMPVTEELAFAVAVFEVPEPDALSLKVLAPDALALAAPPAVVVLAPAVLAPELLALDVLDATPPDDDVDFRSSIPHG